MSGLRDDRAIEAAVTALAARFGNRLVTSQVVREQHAVERHTIEVQGDDELFGEWDARRLGRVLANLVDNAVKYSPDGGAVEVEARRGSDGVRFTVTDQGLGVPEAERGRIFEKFVRLDPHMRRGIPGTGLGLYICRELVEQMGGRIWIDDNEGRGSTFAFELPAAHT